MKDFKKNYHQTEIKSSEYKMMELSQGVIKLANLITNKETFNNQYLRARTLEISSYFLIYFLENRAPLTTGL